MPDRVFYINLPKDFKENIKYKALIIIHGSTINAKEMAKYSRMHIDG